MPFVRLAMLARSHLPLILCHMHVIHDVDYDLLYLPLKNMLILSNSNQMQMKV